MWVDLMTGTEGTTTPKPFLRCRGGFTGRLMNKINYPVLNKSGSDHSSLQTPKSQFGQECSQSSGRSSTDDGLSENKSPVEGTRPFTAGTTDSGYKEGVGSILLSPANNGNHEIESVIIDVTNSNSPNSQMSGNALTSVGPSIIHDVTDHSTEYDVISASSRRTKKLPTRNYRVNDSVVNSTTEFERVEAHVNAVISPLSSSDNSSSRETDGSQSVHWRRIIHEYKTEVQNSLGHFKNDTACASPKSMNLMDEGHGVHPSITDKQQFQSRFTRNRPAPYPTTSLQQSNRNHNAEDVNMRIEAEYGYTTTAILEKSVQRIPLIADHQITESESSGSSRNGEHDDQNLVAQLRNLICDIGNANEERQKQFNRVDNALDEVFDEKEILLRKVSELQQRITQLEENKKSDKVENFTRVPGLGQLQKDNLMNRMQKQKVNDESTIVKLLKDQVSDLRRILNDLERQRTDLRLQLRKANATIAQKNAAMEKLKEEKERIEKRLITISKDVASVRGRAAHSELLSQAVSRASKKPTVTTSTKDLNDNGNRMQNALPTRYNNNEQNQQVPNIENAETISDDGVHITYLDANNQPIYAQQPIKNVHWDEPIATSDRFAPPLYPSTATHTDLLNADMHLVLTENNLVGRASLYRSEEDFTVFTTTHCGCSFYEYSNTDTRWVHPSKRFQVNYYGQAGVTTVEIDVKALLVRHFLSGQLEIYRESGQTTLVTVSGRRIEVIKDRMGCVRVEIYEADGSVRVIGRDGVQTVHRATQTSCHRTDGSYVCHVQSDDSFEWRSPDYVVRRFKNGDAKVRINLIDTSITMLVMDVGTVKHLSRPVNDALNNKYCVEWGTVARKRSRVVGQRHVLNQL